VIGFEQQVAFAETPRKRHQILRPVPRESTFLRNICSQPLAPLGLERRFVIAGGGADLPSVRPLAPF
jgi:hypothetical protein